MADKRISDLDATSVLSDDDIFLVRKTSQNEDFKITKSSLVSNLSNPGIVGFSATGTGGDVTLTPLNGSTITGYLDGMKISFISPVSLIYGKVIRLRIGNNAFVSFLSPLRLRTYPKMDLNEYYEGVYRNGSFYHTNPKEVNYTNETTGSGVISNNTTTYTLTSATGFYRRFYYSGMSVLFTSNIDSTGLVYINLDSLGPKLLSDPDGDGVPFSLVKNQTIMAIYDGTKFIKNSFTMQEPEVPFDPSEPVIIYVGPNEEQVSNTTLQRAIDRILWDYGSDGGGRKVIIKFRDDYNGDGYTSKTESTKSFITIEGNPNVIMKGQNKAGVFRFLHQTKFKLTGTWITLFERNSNDQNNNSPNNCFFYFDKLSGSMPSYIEINDAIIINQNNDGFYNHPCFYFHDYPVDILINNCTITNFGNIYVESNSDYFQPPAVNGYNIICNNLLIRNTLSMTLSQGNQDRNILNLTGRPYNFDNLQFDITKLSNFKHICYASTQIILKNCNQIFQGETQSDLYHFYDIHFPCVIKNCTIKYANNILNTKRVISIANPMRQSSVVRLEEMVNILSPNTNLIPDLLVTTYGTTIIKQSSFIGRAMATNGGIITYV